MAYNDFKRYVWLVDWLNLFDGLTFEEIDLGWQEARDLNPEEKHLPIKTFYNHINAIKSIFDIDIKLNRKDSKYRVHIDDTMSGGRMQKELMTMLSLNSTLDKFKELSGRILYEEEPHVFPEWMRIIIYAMKHGKMIKLEYRKFGEEEAETRILAPYCLKMFKRRWYLLAKEKKSLKTFALDDRTIGVEEWGETFSFPKDFNAEEYFKNTYGIRTAPPKRIVLKAYGSESDYLRSTPLHPSQKEEETGDGYAIFSLFVGMDAWEFHQEILSRGDRIEVLEPKTLREDLYNTIEKMRTRYAEFWQNKDGGSEKNSDIGATKNPDIMMNTNIPTWDTQAAAIKAAKGSFAGKSVRADVYKNNNEIFAARGYKTGSGKVVALPEKDDPMLKGTIVYSKHFWLSKSGPCYAAGTETKVVNDDSFRVAKQMLDEGFNPAVLNLADCYTACGWYPRGSNAQEESLCRVSTLSRSLYQYYTENMATTVGVSFKGKAYPMDYHYGGIYSPGVTVFRDGFENYRLLEEPYKVSVISVAALNFRDRPGHPARDGQYRSADGGFTPEGLEIMQDKIRTIYRIALVNGHDSVVLGAFGCGAFRLKSEIVARLFYDILEEDEFIGRFKEVRFAILERGTPGETGLNGRFRAFYEMFRD